MTLPHDFIDYTRSLLGNEQFEALKFALEQPQTISIRLNSKLGDLPSLTDRVAWCDKGFYLSNRPSFTFDPLFHAGCYYVQEASSMFLEQAVRQYIDEPVIALDLCAAPGGKSTHLHDVLPEGSLLVSNEIIHSRSQILAENMIKWGYGDVIVTNNEPAAFSQLRHQFDLLLTDMPCSGEGMFRKDETAIREWSHSNVEMCAQRQREIISSAWNCLRPGGILIYSTCTFNTLENEENILWICNELGAEALEVNTKSDWNITGNLLPNNNFPVYRLLPGHTRGEGLFVCVLRKKGESTRQEKKHKESKKHLAPITGIRELMITANKYITDNEQYQLTTDGKTITAFPKIHRASYEAISKYLHIIHYGITVGEIRGRDLLPTQSLALSHILNRNAFASQDLSYDEAITLLRKETFLLHEDTPRGCVLLTYHNVPLGFVKNMGNRINNLYPQEWRIRSSHTPDEKWTIV
jgi:16S rRNA (cytosine1407-C5)-methyltransferase